MSERGPLLSIKLNGEVVAEATLIVHDAGKAWYAFLEAFPEANHLIAGEVLNTMRIACHDDLWEKQGAQGIVIDLKG